MPTPREASIWGKIRNDLSRAQQSILNGQYSQAMILNRSILKTLVRMQIDRAVLVSNTLESDIDQLFENQLISSETKDNYHTIRIYGDQAEAGDEPTSQAANESYSLINEELSKYMDSNQTRVSVPSYDSSYARSVQETVSIDYEENPSSDDSDDFGESESSDTDLSTDSKRLTSKRVSFSPDLGGVNIPLSNGASSRNSGRRANGRKVRPVREAAGVQKNGGRRLSSGRVNRKARSDDNRPRKGQDFELDAYNILKFAIPIACVVLLIILIKIIMGGSGSSTIETTAAQTETAVETTAASAEITLPEESVPETEAASSIWVTTTGVKVRTEPNTDCQVLEVLDAGVEVNYKGDANDEWIQIDYNGRDAYVSKQFVQPVAAETQSVADAGSIKSVSEGSSSSTTF